MVSEIHALVSAAKPLLTWSGMAATQECREACGGHGFLKSSRLGDLRATVDPCVTYEGDNNVLVQQTSNWLLRQWQNFTEDAKNIAPLGSIDFLKEFNIIQKQHYTGQDPEKKEGEHVDSDNENNIIFQLFFCFEYRGQAF